MNLDDIMDELRIEYIDSFKVKKQNLLENLHHGKISEIELEFHKMKGTGQTYGIDEISSLGLTMEEICQQNPSSLKEALPLAIELIDLTVNLRSQGQAFNIITHPTYIKLKSWLHS